MMYYSRPCYIGVAVDIGPQLISPEPLSTPLTTTLSPNDPTLEADIIGKIVREICSLKKTVIIIDGSMYTHTDAWH
jgi:TPP-dependent 2-oxoacid decarboxylase